MLRARFAILLICSLCAAAMAQEPNGLRFTAPERSVQMRVEVFYPGGTTLYDSDWKSGNILDWNAADLPYGSYRLRILSRDLEGRLTEKQTTLQVSADRITIDPPLPEELKLTTTAHDGTTGQLITTSGDLSFRFGDYLHRMDSEAMRLTAEGNLDVRGWIRPAGGILFPDGSTLTSAFVDEGGRTRASRGGSTDKKLTPRPEASGTGTMNQVAKWTDNAGTLGDSALTESGGNVGIGTTNPSGKLHIFGAAASDVFAGMGVDMIAGPAFNFGYGGASFGRSAGFFNVRPDASAVPPNPSLRFMTGNVERMIVTNTGDIGIGTSTPGGRFHLFAAPTADVFAGIGTNMSTGPSFNFGYGGATFGRGAGFFNVRPDASATAPNPSLRFMTANVERMIITNAGNVGIGTGSPSQKLEINGNLALPLTASGGTAGVIMLGDASFAHNFTVGDIGSNTFVGRAAGNFTTIGAHNTGVGLQALANVGVPSDNTAVGSLALASTTTGGANTAIGRASLINNTTGGGNIAVGAGAGQNLTTGSNNIDIGNSGVAAESGTIRIGTPGTHTKTLIGDFAHNFGVQNTFLGTNAGNFTMTGCCNTASGYTALQTNTTGNASTASGYQALLKNTTGTQNTASGAGALANSTTGWYNTAFGASALQNNTTGNSNIAIGAYAGTELTTGDFNINIGTSGVAGEANTIRIGQAFHTKIFIADFAHNFGSQNTFLGKNSGNLTMTGDRNTVNGFEALLRDTTGSGNTASGVWTLSANTTGNHNTASGEGALLNNTSGNDNTAIGYNALVNNIGGLSNIAIGSVAGNNLTTGSNNIDIGNSGVPAESSAIRIGTGGTHTKAFMAGIFSVTTGGSAIAVMVDGSGQLGTFSSSRRYKFDISDMGASTASLMRLRPVTFRYIAHGEHAPLQYGLIAEEVAEVYPELVTRNKDGEVETVMYQFLTPMLLNEVQKQQHRLEDEHAENAGLRVRLDELEKVVQSLKREK